MTEKVSNYYNGIKNIKSQKYFLLKPQFMKSFFTHKQIPHNLRKGHALSLPRGRSTYYGTNSVYFRGYFIWNNLPSHIKSSRSLGEFKNNLENFRDIYCWCSICRKWTWQWYSVFVCVCVCIYIYLYVIFYYYNYYLYCSL